ncbi:MAG: hypothetical protein ABSB74_15500 [Tepidisphaeraceae bacterium]
MSDLKRFGNDVWDRLFDLLYDCDKEAGDAAVKARLQSAGIDMRPAYRRMHLMIEERKARKQLAQAAATRALMINKLQMVITPRVDNLRAGIKNLIETAFTGSAQVAHYQKLEKASSEDDLKTLFEDLTRLAALREPQDKNERKAE